MWVIILDEAMSLAIINRFVIKIILLFVLIQKIEINEKVSEATKCLITDKT